MGMPKSYTYYTFYTLFSVQSKSLKLIPCFSDTSRSVHKSNKYKTKRILKMGTKITTNAVLECRNQVAAKRILMVAMNGRLYSYLEPLLSGLADDETENWRWKNWGCSMEPSLTQAGS